MKNKLKPKLYTLSTCMHCSAMKRFLKKHGIEYDYVDVDRLNGKERDEVRQEVLKLTGSLRFPTTVIVGFFEDELKKALKL